MTKRNAVSHRIKISNSLDELFEAILTQPTAPFRESWVKRACLSMCQENESGTKKHSAIPVYEDPIGNLWLNAKNATEAARASLVFVAHLDHPGIVITKFIQKGRKIFAEGTWLGGGPMDIQNFDVKVFSDVNALMVFDGVVQSHTAGLRGPEKVRIEIKPSLLASAAATAEGLKALGPWGACLWFRKQGVPAGVKKQNGELVTKAADDLAGACALIDGLRRAELPKGVVALLTRAEESGFHGTLEVLHRKILNPRKTLMISIETSSQLPGGELGKGPVVRLGDRATVFDPALVFWVQTQAARLAEENPSFQFQRRVMDGGACEATAFNAFGFHVAGISTPLKNYHNLSPSGRPLPEAISLEDAENLAVLIAKLMREHRASHIKDLRKHAFGAYAAKLMENQRAHEKYFDGF